MITFRQQGDFKNLTSYLERAKEIVHIGTLNKYGDAGVAALASATPMDTGLASSSWYYTIKQEKGRAEIIFCNSDIEDGVPIAIILQYGHATKNGSWVEGRDYINPALKPIFDQISNDMWREVSSL